LYKKRTIKGKSIGRQPRDGVEDALSEAEKGPSGSEKKRQRAPKRINFYLRERRKQEQLGLKK